MGIIKNRSELATTPLRADALAILEAGFDAIRTDRVIKNLVELDGETLRVGNEEFNLASFERLCVVAIGKCALDASKALEEVLGDRITSGISLDVRKGELSRIESLEGSHPLPSSKNVSGTEKILSLLSALTEHDIVMFVISGGGSSLLCLPRNPDSQNAVTATRMLMDRGAKIREINIVRRHASLVKGGQLAIHARPARAVSLIFSDVPGDDLSVIASGPTVPDPTTVADAHEVLARYGVSENALTLGETPKDRACFSHVTNILALTNKTALEAMREEAQSRGYRAAIHASDLEGDAREVARMMLLKGSEQKSCELYGGEITVRVKSSQGKGGRNQELVLAALQDIPKDAVIVAAASDGWDNSDVAGALGDSLVREEAARKSVSPVEYLEAHNSYLFFEETGGHIRTGRTGSNVADFYFTLRS